MRIIVKGSVATILAPLSKLPEMTARAMHEGLQEGGDKVRTQVRRALKQQTNVKRYGAIVAHAPGSRKGMIYTITGLGKGLKIEEFPLRLSKSRGQWVRWSPREHWKLQKRESDGSWGAMPDQSDDGEVYAVPWSVGRTFKRSFARPDGKMLQAIHGKGKRRWSFRALYGPSIAKEIVKDESLVTFYATVETEILPAIEKRLARVLG